MRLIFVLLLLVWSTAGFSQCGDCQYGTGNLVINGDFQAGNTGFTTEFTYPSTPGPWGLLSNSQTFAIGTDANDFHVNFAGLDHTNPGTGNFMVVNGSSLPMSEVWCQTFDVIPNTDYTFAAWAQYIDLDPAGVNNGISELQFSANGVLVGGPTIIDGAWEEFSAVWNSGSNTQVELCVMDLIDTNSGNDFGLDDISATACVDIQVEHVPFAGWNATVCSGQPITVGEPESIDFNYSWTLGQYLSSATASNPTVTIVNPTANPISYTFVLTTDSAGLGCTQVDDVTITILPTPSPNLGADLVLCEGQTATLDVGSGWESIEWDDGADTQTVSVSEAGTYSVTVTLNSCPGIDDVVVTIPVMPDLNLPDYLALCEGESAVLDAGVIGTWSTSDVSSTLEVSDEDIYTFVYDDSGCTTTDFTTVEVFAYPDIDLGADLVICPGESVIISLGSTWPEIEWSTGAETMSILVDTPDLYSVSVTENNCTSMDWIVVSQPALPIVDLGPDSVICEDESITLSSGLSGSWNTGESGPSIQVAMQGIYWFEYVDLGCTVRDSVFVEMVQYPDIDLGDDFELCLGESVLLDIEFPGLWSTGVMDSSIVIWEAGYYSVEAHRAHCYSFGDVLVTDIAFPEIDLGPNRILCFGEELEFGSDAEQNRHYMWSTADTSNFVSVEQSIILGVDVWNQCGLVSDVVEVIFEDCDYTLYIPNAFTPDQDGLNDVFRMQAHNLAVFEFWIFDRWGNMVFTSTDPTKVWSGDVLGGDYFAPDGVYFYRVQAETTKNHLIDRFGHITLIR
jgi:gliding motility-associated-like protein